MVEHHDSLHFNPYADKIKTSDGFYEKETIRFKFF